MTDFANLETLRANAARHHDLAFVRVRRQQQFRQAAYHLLRLLLEITLVTPTQTSGTPLQTAGASR